MEKLGLVRDIDLALHLPLRYEDETRLTPMSALRDGDTAQVEAVVREASIQGGRRQLVVWLVEGRHELILRFVHFFPSHQKALVPGALVRARGEVRGGFLGARDGPSGVQGRAARRAAVRRAHAGLPDQRATAAGVPAQGGRGGPEACAAGRGAAPGKSCRVAYRVCARR